MTHVCTAQIGFNIIVLRERETKAEKKTLSMLNIFHTFKFNEAYIFMVSLGTHSHTNSVKVMG